MKIGIRVDAGATTGVGHLIRCAALAEEFAARGIEPVFLGELDGLPWAHAQLDERGFALLPGPSNPEELARVAVELGLDAMVIDSYTLDPSCAGAVRAAGVPVLAIVDGETRGQDADLYLEQNLGGTLAEVDDPSSLLLGLPYALLRTSVRQSRPAQAPTAREVAVPSVLAFFGGTDAFGAAPILTSMLIETGVPFEATVVAASDRLRGELEALAPASSQRVTVIGTTDRLPELVAANDLVVSASGTSMWELACLGAAAALVWVVENQRDSYARVIDQGLAAGLGQLAELTSGGRSAAVKVLRAMLTEPALRTRLARTAYAAVDGRGRERVADALVRAAAKARTRNDIHTA